MLEPKGKRPSEKRAKPKAPPAARKTSSPVPRAEREVGRAPMSSEERLQMITEAAYYRALRRGFAPGDPVRDWLEAEVEIDAIILRTE